MDPRLAEIYGTNSEEQTQDTEKVAAAQLAEKLAGDESLNLEGMSEDQIEALAQEVLAQGAGEQTEEAEATEETEEKQASEKLAEADYLGRVMAHSYVQELRSIEKEASAPTKKEMRKAEKMNPDSRTQKLVRRGQHMANKGKKGLSEGLDRAKAVGAITAGKVSNFAAKHPKKMKGLAGLGLLGAGVAAGRKSKEASALDTLAAQRALEILAENGIDYNEEAEVEEKTASNPADALAAAVEARAMELLQAEGYEFESEEAEAE